MVRVTSVIASAPFFGSFVFPIRVKAFFAIAVTILLYPTIPLQGAVIATDATAIEVTIAIFREMTVGVAMGLVGQIIFGGIQFGGQFISIQVGLGFANIVDPQNQIQNPIFSQVFTFLAIIVFMGIDGEAMYLAAMAKSFEIVPLGTADATTLAPGFVELASELFLIGVQLAAPFIVVIFLLDLSFAIFARIMPQANIFFVALPLKIMGGLIMLVLVVPKLGVAFKQFFTVMYENLGNVLQAM